MVGEATGKYLLLGLPSSPYCDRANCLAPYQAAMSSEQAIRDLCARVVAAQGEEFTRVAADLQVALKAHTEHLRAMAVAALVNRPSTPTDLVPEAE